MVEVVWSAVTRQTAQRPMFDNFLILGTLATRHSLLRADIQLPD
jgi:hypothetical protein